jgi:hypothetical protein
VSFSNVDILYLKSLKSALVVLMLIISSVTSSSVVVVNVYVAVDNISASSKSFKLSCLFVSKSPILIILLELSVSKFICF